MEITLYRHGATPGNIQRLYVGSGDQPLAEEGREQAAAAAKTAVPVQLVYRSPMLRCRETADIIYPDTEKLVVEGLHETNFGDFEGRSYDQLRDDPAYQAWLSGGDPKNGEGREHAKLRVTEAFRWAVDDARRRGLERIAIVCHGGTIMYIMSSFAQPRGEYFDYLLPNCGHYTVSCEGESPVLRIISATESKNFLLDSK